MTAITRRGLLRDSLLVGAGVWVGTDVARAADSPNEKLNIAIIGIDGRGAANLAAVAPTENIVALCDVDEEKLARVGARFPQAHRETDYRRLFSRPDIDAVMVSTPDHHHAPAASMALRMKKHVYCEKPLTHSIAEARALAKLAKHARVATQMGNQGHSNDGTRRVVELVRAGAVGPIREAHCWTDRPIWPQGGDRPAPSPAPSSLHWDLWLGPAPVRPHAAGYHPFAWRGWWDFGTGALGDMACHVMDTAYWALELGAPKSVEAWGEPHHPDSAPRSSVIRYEFGARGEMPPMSLTWYDGGKKPASEFLGGKPYPDNGTLLIGDKGKILLPDPYGSTFVLLPEKQFEGFQPPAPTIPNSIGHHAEWLLACKTGSPTGSNFKYATGLTEMVLLGNVAFRAGHKILWDARKVRVTNCAEAAQFVAREYREGWSL